MDFNNDFRIPFDNGYIVPAYCSYDNEVLSAHCIFIENDLTEDVLILFETKYIKWNTLHEIITNTIEADDFEVR